MSQPAPIPAPPVLPEGKISLNEPKPAPAPTPAPQPEPAPNPNPNPAPDPDPAPAPDPVDTPDPDELQEPGQPDADAIADEDDINAQLEFFNEVNRMRGIDIKVEYGDVMPNSAEGIALRDRAVAEDALARYEQELAQRDPRAAAYMLHRLNGGTDEEFFSRKTLSLPDYDLFRDNVDLQKQVYRNDLINKGLDATKADALVELAIKDNTLLTEADAAYRRQNEEDARELDRLAKAAADEAKAWQQQVNSMDTLLNTTIKSKDLKVIIPDAEQKEFNNYVRDLIQHDGRDFYVAQKLDPAQMATIIEALYVQFKKGDLSAIIARKANTLTVKRNQIALAGTRKTQTAPAPNPAQQTRKTLGQIKFPGEA